eukprot:6486330-Amphidinium_carterae.1
MLNEIASRSYSRGLSDCKVSMIPKDTSVPALGKLRPISVFSTMVRAFNGAATRSHSLDLSRLLHRCQRACHAGAWTYRVVAEQLFCLETAQRKKLPCMGLALDLTMAFNEQADALSCGSARGIHSCRIGGFVRLDPWRSASRGWGQGMLASPRAADLILYPLLVHLDRMGIIAALQLLVTWQDDVQAISGRLASFLQLLKTPLHWTCRAIWAIHLKEKDKDEIRALGWTFRDYFVSLGFTIHLAARDKDALSEKDRAMVEEVKGRIGRDKHVPRPPA